MTIDFGGSIARPSRGSDADIDVVALDLHGIGGNVDHGWLREDLAGLDAQARLMDRAFDDVALDEAVGQDGVFVRTEVADGVDVAIDEIDADQLAVDLDGQRFIRRQLRPARHSVPGHVIAHGHGFRFRLRDYRSDAYRRRQG